VKWSEIARQAIVEKLEKLMARLNSLLPQQNLQA